MSNMLWKNFHFCFSKLIKCLPTIQSSSESSLPPPEEDIFSSQPPPAICSSTAVNSFNNSLFNDFSSANFSTSISLSITPSNCFSSSDNSLSDYENVPDFASLFASPRFFFSSPGRSKAIFDQSSDARISFDYTLVAGGVKIRKYSTDPCLDFRRSMQEMIEARAQRTDWVYLQELLLCYLQMNSKNTHKFILSAFSDLVVSLLASSTIAIPDHVQPQSQTCKNRPDSFQTR